MSSPATTHGGPRRPEPMPMPRVGGTTSSEATAVEQSRAASEVYAAVLSAKHQPRDVQAAIRDMQEACAIESLAARAFYRYKRGGQIVTGPTIQLARELARCWGNVQYGIHELARHATQSEILAFAWDLQSNTRESRTIVVPHTRDKTDGLAILTDNRDIYESNANAGARRVRETILGVLPVWFVEDAKDRCRATIDNGGGLPLATRISKALASFAQLGVSEGQLVAHVGAPAAKWTALDLTPLLIIHGSLSRGESTVRDEFPPAEAGVSGADVAGFRPAPGAVPRPRGARPDTPTPTPAAEPEAPAPAPAEAAQPETPADPETPAPGAAPETPAATPATPSAFVGDPFAGEPTPPANGSQRKAAQTQHNAIMKVIGEYLPSGTAAAANTRHALYRGILRADVGSGADLTTAQAAWVLSRVEAWRDAGELGARIAAITAAAPAGDQAGDQAGAPAGDAPAAPAAPAPAPAAPPAGELPAPGTRAWHDAGHPQASDGGRATVAVLMNGDCGICEQDHCGPVPQDDRPDDAEDDPRDDDGYYDDDPRDTDPSGGDR